MAMKIFFCYAHEDEALLKKLKIQLKPLLRQGLVDTWHDRDIEAGTEWEREISQHLNTAQIILLLISPDFMNSDYCYSVEMKRALELHKQGNAHVIPIILRPVHWQEKPLNTLQALPTDARPVKSWPDLDEAFFNVADGIRKVIIRKKEEAIQQQEYERAQRYNEATQVSRPATISDRDRFDAFTEQARKVLSFAQQEAKSFQHNYIGTEHLLLGLVRESDGVAAKVLTNLGVELNKARSAVEFIIGRGDRIVLDEIGLTPRAKKVIELAVDEARRLNHYYIGTEHILLGMLREGDGIGVGVLESFGVNLEKARNETIWMLNLK